MRPDGGRVTIDPALHSEIRSALHNLPGCSELSEEASTKVTNALQARFVREPEQTWWWSSLADDPVMIDYGDGDGLAAVSRILPSEENAYLIITDDERPPWPVIHGRIKHLLLLLKEVRFCEYCIMGEAYTWVIFDTHHNRLVIAGKVVEG